MRIHKWNTDGNSADNAGTGLLHECHCRGLQNGLPKQWFTINKLKKRLFTADVTEAGCMAHARRKFFDLHANNQSQIADRRWSIFRSSTRWSGKLPN